MFYGTQYEYILVFFVFSFLLGKPGTYPKEKKLQSKHGESLKSRIVFFGLRFSSPAIFSWFTKFYFGNIYHTFDLIIETKTERTYSFKNIKLLITND